MSPAQGADGLVAAIDLAAARAAEVGRRIADSAEDLDSVARRLGGRATDGEWSGRAGERARGEAADAAVEALMLSGNCLFVADVLRVEGSRLARAVTGWAAAEAAEPGTGDAVAVQDADRVLAMRLREAADGLAGRVDPATRPCLDLSGSTDGDPREVARLWHSLGPADRARLARDHPGLGSAAGLSSATRDAINRTRLRRLLDAPGSGAGSGAGTGGRPSDEAARDLAALAAYLEQDPRRHLLDLHPDGRAVVASADPDSAERVVTLVPGTGSSLADLGRTGERAGAVCEAADAADAAEAAGEAGAGHGKGAAGECVAVSWQGYDAPDGIVSAGSSAGPAWAHADDLRTYAAGLDAVEGLDGDDAPHATVGYSYGSVVLGAAAADPEGLAADLMIHVGSPGAGVESLDRQWVDEAGVSRPAVDDDVVAVASRWDPVPWWSITGVLGERPGTDEFGGRSVDVTEPGAGPESVRTAHSRYLDPGTVSLTEIGRLVSGIE
ncbi:alpha/beta hydrolase family protein [Dietzia cinnamea]|uniref:alpha/beta hydrolase family protein n=1 Tax=Dietzia cinnamea TaxID=321318 RepID=UPI0021A70A47|nr:alpha/beta hydrolase family protein [Dietzia cinnamea]MCT1884563.1 alpha/beta hydrolase family protein [Dietzia cinnamea]MCT2099190.1 alpha/beta hydrolase family protein [Dietzia cinnamea]MCT2140039.1 alpha/beta hydrolase family protein [Dietzia cinnamea]